MEADWNRKEEHWVLKGVMIKWRGKTQNGVLWMTGHSLKQGVRVWNLAGRIFGNLYITLRVTLCTQPLLEVNLLNVNQSNHSLIGAVCVLWVQEHISNDIERHPRSFQPRCWLKPHFYSLNCLSLISFPSLPSNISLNSFFLPSLRCSGSLFMPLLPCSCFSFLFLSLFLSVIAPFFFSLLRLLSFLFLTSGRLEQLLRPHRNAQTHQSPFVMAPAQKVFTLL